MTGALPVPPRDVPGTGSPGSSIAAAATAIVILDIIIIHGTGAVRVLVAGPWIVEEVFSAGAVKITVACVLRCGKVAMLLTCHISTSGRIRVAGLPAAHNCRADGLYHYKRHMPIFQTPGGHRGPATVFHWIKTAAGIKDTVFRARIV